MAKNQIFCQVSGLNDIRKGLIKSDKEIKKEIRSTFKKTAEFAASEARSRVPVLSGNARRSVKAGTSGATATVRGGANKGQARNKAPYYGWLDFGGTISPRGVKIVRPAIKTPGGKWNGRYIYPAMRDKLEVAVRFLNDELAKILDRQITKEST